MLEIELEFDADVPRGRSTRKLVLENHHQSPIAAYQVNCLAPRDPEIRVIAQNRNYTQSFYELDYAQPGVRPLSLAWWSGPGGWLGTVTLLFFARLAFVHFEQSNLLGSKVGIQYIEVRFVIEPD